MGGPCWSQWKILHGYVIETVNMLLHCSSNRGTGGDYSTFRPCYHGSDSEPGVLGTLSNINAFILLSFFRRMAHFAHKVKIRPLSAWCRSDLRFERCFVKVQYFKM